MHDSITVETDRFEHREVKPHFINPAGLNVFKRLFHRPDARAFARLRDSIWQSLRANGDVKII